MRRPIGKCDTAVYYDVLACCAAAYIIWVLQVSWACGMPFGNLLAIGTWVMIRSRYFKEFKVCLLRTLAKNNVIITNEADYMHKLLDTKKAAQCLLIIPNVNNAYECCCLMWSYICMSYICIITIHLRKYPRCELEYVCMYVRHI